MGSATYAVLNLIFITVATAVTWTWLRRNYRHFFIVTAHLLVMTAIFDSLAIHFRIFSYDSAYLSGLYIIKAPIEDFAYTIAAALIVPKLWQYFGKTKDEDVKKS